jgi:hypothetical protein
MALISFPSNIFISSCDFAKARLNHALSGRNITNLTQLEKDTINSNLRNAASGEYKKFLRNAILTNLVAAVLFSAIILAPLLSMAAASVFVCSSTLVGSLGALTLIVSPYALRKIYFLYEDFKLDHATSHKHNYEALIYAAKTVKKHELRSIPLLAQDKANIQAMLKEIELSYVPNPFTLESIGEKLVDSALANNSLADMLAYIFLDPEVHTSVENVLHSSVKKKFIVFGLNQLTSTPAANYQFDRSIPRFASLVEQDETVIRNLYNGKNWEGIINLLIF